MPVPAVPLSFKEPTLAMFSLPLIFSSTIIGTGYLLVTPWICLHKMNHSSSLVALELLKVPVMFLKAVTDLIDGDKPTAEEFLQNLSLVTSALEETATKVINFINGKTLSDL
ncbi:hypothetical protein F2Q69_00058053 [Brassica cretica]|uniref:Uncharacterized protein n=1 Tax=Brassica cretica TaxID=69181 RepID=A0A8S9N5C8_BRACR|nr:hypothetical protein F2Q69_00058053 [Brassica cretica]